MPKLSAKNSHNEFELDSLEVLSGYNIAVRLNVSENFEKLTSVVTSETFEAKISYAPYLN